MKVNPAINASTIDELKVEKKGWHKLSVMPKILL